MLTLKDGQTFTGTDLQILRQMQALSTLRDSSLDDYIAWMVGNVLEFDDVQLAVIGDTEDARAESLLGMLVMAGLAVRS